MNHTSEKYRAILDRLCSMCNSFAIENNIYRQISQLEDGEWYKVVKISSGNPIGLVKHKIDKSTMMTKGIKYHIYLTLQYKSYFRNSAHRHDMDGHRIDRLTEDDIILLKKEELYE